LTVQAEIATINGQDRHRGMGEIGGGRRSADPESSIVTDIRILRTPTAAPAEGAWRQWDVRVSGPTAEPGS
jgi:hypothetical protein